MAKKIRPAAVPLITVDPFFSVWSCSDTLTDGVTKHWSEAPQPLLLGLYIGEKYYSMGTVDDSFIQYRAQMCQMNLKVTPLSTEYVFENEFANVKLTFTTPLILDRPDVLARPVSYIAYEIEMKSETKEAVELAFGISARCCVNSKRQNVAFSKTPYSLCCGNVVQTPLAQSGDMNCIDWGYLHLCDPKAFVGTCVNRREIRMLDINASYNAFSENLYLMVRRGESSGVITVAYDEIKAVEYFGQQLDEYYTRYFDSFGEMVAAAKAEYPMIKAKCDAFALRHKLPIESITFCFDRELMAESESVGEDYKTILCLAYRQAIAAHKLVADENGELIFLSKECGSNGCIGTLDVTYPSIPLFLRYNPEFVLGMLRPIIRYAKTDAWEFEFAPHDVGEYPLANGQVYGFRAPTGHTYEGRRAKQMPVEESGNMLLCLAAVAKYSGETPALFTENQELMKQWTDYMVEYGYDPGNQLCTDDFAGHLNHNCNLSLKAILGIASYAKLSGDMSYMEVARQYAEKWEKDAKADHVGTKLVFDDPNGWSLKYNIVWDTMLGFDLFSEEMKKREIALYTEKMNHYGVPLDSRSDYTKLDWLMWSTRILKNDEYTAKVCECIVRMINETPDRVPLTDWYYTSTAKHINFQNRSVVGGLFIHLLA